MALTRYPSFGPDQPGMVEIAQEATFATAPGSLAFVRTIDNLGGLEAIHKLMLEDESLRQDLNRLAMIPGYENASDYFVLPEGSTVTTKQYLAGLKSTVPDAKTDYSNAASLTVGTGYPLIWTAYAMLGGLVSMDALEVTAATSTVQVLEIDTTADYDVGGMVTADVSATADADYESGWLKTVTTDDAVTLRVDLSAAPAVSNTVYGSVVTYLKSYLEDSFTLRWTGHKVDSTTPLRATLVGCVPASAVIEIPAFGLPTIEVTWNVSAAMWEDTSSTGVSLQTWTYPAPEQAIGHRVQYVPAMVHGDSEDLGAASVKISIDNGLQPVVALSSEFGIKTYIKTAQTVSVEMHAPYTASLRQAHAAQTEVGLEIELGSQPGKRIGIAAPGLVIETFSGPVSENGVAYCDATMRQITYDGDTGAGTDADLIDKAFAIGWG